jgi:bis(5'-nucleosyl)-tetraphosphatase (symmetrical)
MGERFAAVLGNHDLRLLALAAGLTAPKRLDTLEEVLAAPDGDELVGWLGALPLIHEGEAGGEPWLMVHAGLRPEWTVAGAAAAARRVEGALAGPRRDGLLVKGPADPEGDDPELAPLREDLAAFTLLRTLTAGGRWCDFSGSLEELSDGCVPWFRALGRRSACHRIVCGHWAALGLHREEGVLAIDSACVWGRSLTAVRLDDGEVFQQPAVERPDDLPPR